MEIIKSLKDFPNDLLSDFFDHMDSLRFDTKGGYPCEWCRVFGAIVVADVNHDDAPDLTVSKNFKEFMKNYSYWFEEGLELNGVVVFSEGEKCLKVFQKSECIENDDGEWMPIIRVATTA